MIKMLKTIIIGFFIATVKRSLFFFIENYGKKIDFSEITSQILDKREILIEAFSLVIIYYIFEYFLKKF